MRAPRQHRRKTPPSQLQRREAPPARARTCMAYTRRYESSGCSGSTSPDTPSVTANTWLACSGFSFLVLSVLVAAGRVCAHACVCGARGRGGVGEVGSHPAVCRSQRQHQHAPKPLASVATRPADNTATNTSAAPHHTLTVPELQANAKADVLAVQVLQQLGVPAALQGLRVRVCGGGGGAGAVRWCGHVRCAHPAAGVSSHHCRAPRRRCHARTHAAACRHTHRRGAP
jgi:hypothetical protein